MNTFLDAQKQTSPQAKASGLFGKSGTKAKPTPYRSYFLSIKSNDAQVLTIRGNYLFLMAVSAGSSISLAIDDDAKQNLVVGVKIGVQNFFSRITVFNDTSSLITVNLIVGIGDFFFSNVNPSFNSVYFGNPNTDGTWRITINAGNLSFQKLTSGIWTEYGSFS
jgi:hypothetical protein